MFESTFGIRRMPGEEWAFDGKDWRTIPDPMAEWMETEEQFYEGLEREGYFEWFTTGDRGNNFWFTAFVPNPARSSKLQAHFPYLVVIEMASTINTVYCANLPAILSVLEQLSALHTVWRAGKDRYGRSQSTDE